MSNVQTFHGTNWWADFDLAWFYTLIRKGGRLGAIENKCLGLAHTRSPKFLPTIQHRMSGRKSPTPNFPLRREGWSTCSGCWSRDWFLSHWFRAMMLPSILWKPAATENKESWATCGNPRCLSVVPQRDTRGNNIMNSWKKRKKETSKSRVWNLYTQVQRKYIQR